MLCLAGKSRFVVRVAALALAGLGLAATGGCIFDPREPETPGTGEQIDYLPQSQPQNVWANLEKSLENNHAPGWENNISSVEFIYLVDDDTRGQFPDGTFDGWDRSRETNFINNFFTNDVTITAQMRNDDFEIPGTSGNEVRWEGVIYDLTVTNNIDGGSVRYRASADITFRLDDTDWYIYLWDDNVGESPPEGGAQLQTMGVLRGTFGSNP